MRVFRILLLVAVFAVVGVGVSQASSANLNGVPVFTDGRVNDWQIAAPVAIYCVFDNSQNWNVGVFQQIAVWGLNSNEILQASAAKIATAQASFTTAKTSPTSVTLDSEQGYLLSLLSDGSFQVSAPNGYSFSWVRGDTNC